MGEIEQLYRLQEIDEQLAAGERQRQDLAARGQEMERAVAASRAAHERLDQTVARSEHHLHQSEGALREMEGRRQELERRLYGGDIRSEKEVAALQAEITQVREQIDSLESQGLQLLLDLDEQREQAGQAAEAEARQARAAEEAARAAAAAEAALRADMAPLRAARAEQAAGISPDLLALYEQLRRSLARPVARVLEDRCEGCRLEVALLTRKAALGGAIVRCENCGRILFLS